MAQILGAVFTLVALITGMIQQELAFLSAMLGAPMGGVAMSSGMTAPRGRALAMAPMSPQQFPQGPAVPASQDLGQPVRAAFQPTGGNVPAAADPGTPGELLTEGPASHYLGPDDDRPVSPQTGGKQEPAADGTMADSTNPSCAMLDVPLGSIVRVTNMENGLSVIVCVHDRGPYARGRVIDLVYGAFLRIASSPDQGEIRNVRIERLPDGTPTSWPERLISASGGSGAQNS